MKTSLFLSCIAVVAGACGAMEDDPMLAETDQAMIANNMIANNMIANNMIANNMIANNMIANNMISAAILGGNAITANGPALAAVGGYPLSTQTYADFGGRPELHFALRNAETRYVFSYLVQCALGLDQSVTYFNWTTGETFSFLGMLGLARGWATAAPTDTDRELVSACLLARVNAYGVKVQFSMLGEQGPFTPRGVAAQAAAGTTTPDLVAACTNPTTAQSQGVGRNCNWMPRAFGTCTPGLQVRLGVGAPYQACSSGTAVGTASTIDLMVRVCDGNKLCIGTAALAQAKDSCVYPIRNPNPAVTFTCPDSGAYNVMTAPDTVNQSPSLYLGSWGQPGAVADGGVKQPGELYPWSDTAAVPPKGVDQNNVAYPSMNYGFCLRDDAGGNCGYTTDFVGKCVDGATVTLTRQWSYPAEIAVRVCDDDSACDSGSAAHIKSQLVSASSPTLTFTCPHSNFFSVMKGAARAQDFYAPPAPIGARFTVSSSAQVSYRLNEIDLYKFSEGAFFGNFIKAGAVSDPRIRVTSDASGTLQNVVKSSVNKWTYRNPDPPYELFTVPYLYTDMYACWSKALNSDLAAGKTVGEAYLEHRVCSYQLDNCLARPVGACRVDLSPGVEGPGRCASYDPAAANMYYDDCQTPQSTKVWAHPVSTALHDACDMWNDKFFDDVASDSIGRALSCTILP